MSASTVPEGDTAGSGHPVGQHRSLHAWLVIGLVVLGAIATSVIRANEQAVPAGPVSAPPADLPTVEVEQVRRKDLSTTISLPAEFLPYQEIDVHAKVAGYLHSIAVDIGDRVTEGQTIATMDVPEQERDVEQATAARRQAEDDVVRARSELVRAQAAYAMAHLSCDRLAQVVRSRPNLLAQQDVDDSRARDRETQAQVGVAESALAAARSHVDSARATEEKMRCFLSYGRITAPFTGVVTRRYTHVGALIQAGTASNTQTQPLVRLSQNQTLRLVVAVPESIAGRVHVGTPVQVRLPSLGQVLQRAVSRLAERVDVSTRTMNVEIDVPNPDLTLIPGMYAYADITLDRRSKALAVPVVAVDRQDEKATALVVGKDGKLQVRDLALGLETPGDVEVLKGLAEGDRVVLGHHGLLSAGTRVRTKLAQPPSVTDAH